MKNNCSMNITPTLKLQIKRSMLMTACVALLVIDDSKQHGKELNIKKQQHIFLDILEKNKINEEQHD